MTRNEKDGVWELTPFLLLWIGTKLSTEKKKACLYYARAADPVTAALFREYDNNEVTAQEVLDAALAFLRKKSVTGRVRISLGDLGIAKE